MIEPGIYPHLSNEEYHGDSAISRSGIMHFLDSPYKYWANYLNPDKPERESTPAMLFGSAFHTLILEPHLFRELYAIKPEAKLLKDVGRALYDKTQLLREAAESSGKIVLTELAMNTLIEMVKVFMLNDEATGLLQGGAIEKSYFWQDEHSGLMIKARPDILQSNCIVDLKTCADASPRAFQRAMCDGGYHIQGAMIRDAIKALESREIKSVINICVEKTYPYAIGIYFIDEAALDHGHNVYKQALLDIKNCTLENKWSSYEVQSIGLPKWAL